MKNQRKEKNLSEFANFSIEIENVNGGENGVVGARQNGSMSYVDVWYYNPNEVTCDVLVSNNDKDGWINTIKYDFR